MAVFGTVPAPGLYSGDQFNLSTASLGGGVLTQSVAPCVSESGAPANLTLINKSAVSVQVMVARDNVAADFEALLGVVCPATSSISFSTTAPFVAALPASDPGATTITICR